MTPKVHNCIASMSPYSPPLEGRSVGDKLLVDFNERTTPLPGYLVDAFCEKLKENRIHQYPEYGSVVEKIAKYEDFPSDSVMLVNGSGEGIDLVFRCFTKEHDKVVIPAPTFALHTHSAHVQGCNVIEPLYDRIKGYPLSEVLEQVSKGVKVIVVCNPNSPTGTLLEVDKIEEIARQAPDTIVLVDECYFDFCNVTAKELIKKYPNIVVLKTFSKTWGLASFRVGYILADKGYISEFLKVRAPYSVSRIAAEAVDIVLDNPGFFESYVKEVREESKPLMESYFRDNDIEYWPTESNFILFKPKDPVKVEQVLRENNIRVRPRKEPSVKGTIRVTLGTKAQMERVVSVLKTIQ